MNLVVFKTPPTTSTTTVEELLSSRLNADLIYKIMQRHITPTDRGKGRRLHIIMRSQRGLKLFTVLVMLADIAGRRATRRNKRLLMLTRRLSLLNEIVCYGLTGKRDIGLYHPFRFLPFVVVVCRAASPSKGLLLSKQNGGSFVPSLTLLTSSRDIFFIVEATCHD